VGELVEENADLMVPSSAAVAVDPPEKNTQAHQTFIKQEGDLHGSFFLLHGRMKK
jgi:hypothetical protein